MPLDALNTLYKIAIDREAAERKRREEEEQKKKELEKLERQRRQQPHRPPAGNQPPGMNTDPSFYVSQPEAEAFEDELLEEGLM